MFNLSIRTTNAAFSTEGEDREEVFAPESEVQRILRDTADRIEYDTWAGSVFDINGHNVGSFILTEDEPEAVTRVRAYLDELDRVNSRREQYGDAVHAINMIDLNRSDLRALLAIIEGK